MANPPAAAEPTPDPVSDPLSAQVERHLAALGADRFDLRVSGPNPTHGLDQPGLSAAQLLDQVPYLEVLNAQGAEVLIRPAGGPPPTVLAGLSRRDLEAARATGLAPALVLHQDGLRREAWFLQPPPLAPDGSASRSVLDYRFHASKAPAPDGFGHLAGFLAPPDSRARGAHPHARPARMTLVEAAGAPVALPPARGNPEASHPLRPNSDGLDPRGDTRQRHESYALAAGTASPAPWGVPPSPPATVEEAAAQVHVHEWALDRHDVLLAELPAVAPARQARHQHELVHTLREIRETAWRLADWTLTSPARAPHPTAASDGAALREPLRHPERSPALAPVPPAAPAPPIPPPAPEPVLLEPPADPALPYPARTTALLAAEASILDFRRQTDLLARQLDAAALDLARAEQRALGAPSPAHRESFAAHLARVSHLEAALAPLWTRRRLAELALVDRDLARQTAILLGDGSPHQVDRYLALVDRRQRLLACARGEGGLPVEPLPTPPAGAERPGVLDQAWSTLALHASRLHRTRALDALDAARGAFEQALAGTFRTPAAQLDRELHTARAALRRALEDLTPVPQTDRHRFPPLFERWDDALARHQLAETALARHLPFAPRPDAGRDGRLAFLLDRVAAGDLTPQTLSRLHREAALAVGAATGQAPLPPLDRSRDMTLAAAALSHRGERAAFLVAAHRLRDGRHGRLRDLERFQASLGHYQHASARLDEITHRYAATWGGRGGRAVPVPVAGFLDDPRFRLDPHRAVAAWALATTRRLPPRRAAEILTRARGALTSTPSYLSPYFALAVCAGAARLARTFTRAATADLAQEL